MKRVQGRSIEYAPIAHEKERKSGAAKKVLISVKDSIIGRVQMVNLAKIENGCKIRPHYHQNMKEIFIILEGELTGRIEEKEIVLKKEDLLVVDAMEVHSFRNEKYRDVKFIAIGVAEKGKGKTVVI